MRKGLRRSWGGRLPPAGWGRVGEAESIQQTPCPSLPSDSPNSPLRLSVCLSVPLPRLHLCLTSSCWLPHVTGWPPGMGCQSWPLLLRGYLGCASRGQLPMPESVPRKDSVRTQPSSEASHLLSLMALALAGCPAARTPASLPSPRPCSQAWPFSTLRGSLLGAGGGAGLTPKLSGPSPPRGGSAGKYR